MPLILRSDQESKLTIEQLDNNFEYLEQLALGGTSSGGSGATGPAGATGAAGATGPAGSGGSGATGSYIVYGVDTAPIFTLDFSPGDYGSFTAPILYDGAGEVTMFGACTSSQQIADDGRGSTFSLDQTNLNGYGVVDREGTIYTQSMQYDYDLMERSGTININLVSFTTGYLNEYYYQYNGATGPSLEPQYTHTAVWGSLIDGYNKFECVVYFNGSGTHSTAEHTTFL